MKSLLYFLLLNLICATISAQLVSFKDPDANVMLGINDEGKSGSITMLPIFTPPGFTQNKLYNLAQQLYWNGTQLGTIDEAGGWKRTGFNLHPIILTHKIGIGTSAPGGMLDVLFSTSTDNINPVAVFRTGGTGNSSGALKVENSVGNYFTFGITAHPSNSFAIGYNQNISLGSDLLRMTSEGLLGLGTINPESRFHIEGGAPEPVTLTIHNTDDTGSERIFFGTSIGQDAAIWSYGSSASSNTGKLRFLNNRNGAHYDWVINSSVKMTLSNAGNLGVGNNLPGAKIHITQEDDVDAFRVDDSASDTSPFVIRDDGDVGVGLATPLAKQHIYQPLLLDAFRIDDILDDPSPFIVKSDGRTGIGVIDPVAKVHIIQSDAEDAFRVDDQASDSTPFVIDELGNCGVGVPDPLSKHHILQAEVADAFRVDDEENDLSPFIIDKDGDVGIGTSLPGAQQHIIASPGQDALRVYDEVSDATPFVIDAAGKVGVGILDPLAKQHIVYDGIWDVFRIDDEFIDDSPFVVDSNGNVGIGILDPLAKQHIVHTGSGNAFRVDDSEADSSPFVIRENGAVGIGTDFPSWKLHVIRESFFDNSYNANPEDGQAISCFNGDNIWTRISRYVDNYPFNYAYGIKTQALMSGNYENYGIFAQASGASINWAGYFQGDVHVTGTLSKGSGTFKIDHPLDPENKYLSHSFVESPDMMNVYNGNVTTNANGRAEVHLPHYFEALNKDFRYQLTVIGEFAQAIISKEISGNTFEIRTDKPNVKVSWQVTGIRQDAYANKNRVQIEQDKAAADRGTYLHPEAHDKPVEMREGYERMPN